MDTNKRLPDPEIDFPNDEITELVLHKDDIPVIKNGEIINEPEDVEEKAISPEDAGIRFTIHFEYGETAYSAVVRKRSVTNPEYHITLVMPPVPHLPDPFIVTIAEKEKFDFPVNETWYPLSFGLAVIESLKKECHNRNIAISG